MSLKGVDNEGSTRNCEPLVLLKEFSLPLAFNFKHSTTSLNSLARTSSMPFSHLKFDPPGKDIPSQGYSSEFVSKALARLVNPIDPNDPEQYPADLTIKCGSLDVKAHSHVLCPDSSYFKVVCKGGFLEEQTQELKLPADEEFLIRRLLRYRYMTGYSDEPYDDEENPPPHIKAPAYVNRLHLNSQMYSIGDKYDIPSLKGKAAEKFNTAIREIYAHQRMNPYNGASLVDEIIEAIPHIYSSTPDRDRRLRDRAVEIVIYKWREFEDHPGLEDLVAAAPEFFEESGVQSPQLTSRLARFIQFS